MLGATLDAIHVLMNASLLFTTLLYAGSGRGVLAETLPTPKLCKNSMPNMGAEEVPTSSPLSLHLCTWWACAQEQGTLRLAYIFETE